MVVGPGLRGGGRGGRIEPQNIELRNVESATGDLRFVAMSKGEGEGDREGRPYGISAESAGPMRFSLWATV